MAQKPNDPVVVSDVRTLRARGLGYAQIASTINDSYDTYFTAESVRHMCRGVVASKAAPKKAKPTTVALRKVVKTKQSNSRILVISDMHVPYQHPDTIDFLAEVKKRYDPTRIVCVGDEVDHHALSFHDADPDLASAGDEIQKTIEVLQPLYELFPNMDLIDSNHGSMVYRKGKHHGIPRKYIKDYGDVLEAPKGWAWHHDLTLEVPGGNLVFFHHGLSKDVMKVVNQRGVCVVQGHYHTEFRIGYSGNPSSLLWGMNVGCSIDSKSLAFAYDRTNLGRPIIGHGIIEEGLPRLLPMVLDKSGRWIGVVP